MKSVSGKFLCKVVEQRGWNLKRITGSHYIYVKRSVNAILSIPVHGNRDLPIGTLKSTGQPHTYLKKKEGKVAK